MQISLRSHLIAGTAAVVGASAIALTPVVAQHQALPALQVPATSAEVSLAGFDSPISELLKTFGVVNEDLLSGAAPVIAVNTAAGIIPGIIDNPTPIIRQLGTNGSKYLLNTLNSGALIGYGLSEGVWNAAGDLINLNPVGAIQTLLAAVNSAGITALAAGQYVLNGIVTRVQALGAYLGVALPTLLPTVVGQVQQVVGTFTDVFGGIVTSLGGGDFEAAWNYAIDGFFGPVGFNATRSIPGTLLGLTIGEQVNGVPSARTVVNGLVDGLANNVLGAPGIPNPVAPPTAAVKKAAPSASALRKAPAAAAASGNDAPAADNSGGDNGGSKAAKSSRSNDGGSSNSRAAKSGKH